MLFGASFAQTPFFTKTCYRGAFAPSPTPMWTDTSTSGIHKIKFTPAPTQTITGNITSNTTWSTSQVVLLSSQSFIKNNSVLTIQPGVIVLGDKNAVGAGLFVTKGSQLIANGTVTAPIVFTSNQAPGNRTGGIGEALSFWVKQPTIPLEASTTLKGCPFLPVRVWCSLGADDDDNSGSLRYVRIEFAGYAYQQDKEINTLTMGAVGRGTTLEYIQASLVWMDAFEWFGGTVNAKYLVSFRCLDDDFDTDFGYSGNVQFGLVVRDPNLADNPSISTSETFESDNNATGTAATPKASALFSNITSIGPLRGGSVTTPAAGHRRGARIRRNSELKIFNSIFMDNATRGVFIDGSACENNANAGTLKFKRNILAGYGQRAATESGTFGVINTNTFVIAQGNDTLKLSSGILVTPYNYTSPDYRPSLGSIALSGASFTDAVLSSVSGNTAVAIASIGSASVCIGNGTTVTPYTFVASTTVSSGYCSLNLRYKCRTQYMNATLQNPSFTVSTIRDSYRHIKRAQW